MDKVEEQVGVKRSSEGIEGRYRKVLEEVKKAESDRIVKAS